MSYDSQSAAYKFTRPYGNLNWKPMSPKTKAKVKWTRYVLLFLRICELVAALGILFCVICIKKTDASTGWIIRVPVSGCGLEVHWLSLFRNITDTAVSQVSSFCTQFTPYTTSLAHRKDGLHHPQPAT